MRYISSKQICSAVYTARSSPRVTTGKQSTPLRMATTSSTHTAGCTAHIILQCSLCQIVTVAVTGTISSTAHSVSMTQPGMLRAAGWRHTACPATCRSSCCKHLCILKTRRSSCMLSPRFSEQQRSGPARRHGAAQPSPATACWLLLQPPARAALPSWALPPAAAAASSPLPD